MSELIDDKAIEILRHALGIESRRKRKDWGFRNYFVCDDGHPSYLKCCALSEAGYMTRRLTIGWCPGLWFCATRKGMIVAGLFEREADRILEEARLDALRDAEFRARRAAASAKGGA